MDLEQIQIRLYENLKECGWGILRSFILSDDFLNILKKLAEFSADGKNFTPSIKQLFNAFYECPLDKLKVVIVGQDVYPQPGVADGIAFSCSNKMKPEASLKYIQKAIIQTVYQNENERVLSPDLRYLANQGVLLINTAFTTEINKIGKHIELWKPFFAFLIDILPKNILWVFLGAKAQSYSSFVNNYLTATHPAYAAYSRSHQWDCNNIFNKINEWLEQQNQIKIKW